jgi:hypothetical protein
MTSFARRTLTHASLAAALSGLMACEDDAGTPADAAILLAADAATSSGAADAASPGSALASDAGAGGAGLLFRSQVEAITSVDAALPGVFIPPFQHCQAPKAGEPAGMGPSGQVCTNVMISACTEPGRYYPDYADCAVVRRQRPYWPAAPAKVPPTSDPRLSDAAYMAELKWVTEQVAASACTCCHDARVAPDGAASQWDIAAGPLWIDTITDSGLGLFTGLADSHVLGAYEAKDNFGFDRTAVGIPTTDITRMRAFTVAELKRRGLTEDYARGLPPFGGPIYQNAVRPPTVCTSGQGVTSEGSVVWTGGNARYLYVLEVGGPNPGVPPNMDLPSSTLWRLDVLASQPALQSGIKYATTPMGSFQVFPVSSAAPALVQGKAYQLFVQLDMGLPITNCTFTYGQAQAVAPVVDAGLPIASSPDAGSASADAGPADAGSAPMCSKLGPDGDPRGIGNMCSVSGKTDAQCPCAANYCSKSPFDTSGYCTVSGCDKDPSICPAGWSCFNVGTFSPGEPYICMKP